MSDDRCELTDLLRSSCAHCRGDSLPGELDAGPVVLDPPVAWTVAQWPGKCPGPCDGNWIKAGDRIARCGDAWVCETCGEAATA